MLSCDDRLRARPRRVAVAGVAGAGKTTLAIRIAAIVGARHTELDALYHGPNWTPRESFVDDVGRLVAQDSWTTEWQYGPARPLIAERADLLVWLDVPFWTTSLPRVVRRTVRRRLTGAELWNGNREPPLWTFFVDSEHIVRWAASTRNKNADRVPALESEWPHLDVVRLRSAREVERWLRGPLSDAAGGGAD